jgi:ribosomal protein L22
MSADKPDAQPSEGEQDDVAKATADAAEAKETEVESTEAEAADTEQPAKGEPKAKAAKAKAAKEGAKAKAAKAPAKKAAKDEQPKADADEEQPRAEEKKTRRKAAKAPAEQAKAAPSRRDKDAPRKPRRRVVRARARYVRTSARKARMVCGHLRGKSVEEARAILAFTPREVARDWSKLLESAVANAESNHELLQDDLIVREAYADEGPTIKRFRPRAMGRATPIRKRTSHLTITLTARPEQGSARRKG